MNLTLSVIQAGIKSIDGRMRPAGRLVQDLCAFVRDQGLGLLVDPPVDSTGEDVAMPRPHERGVGDERILPMSKLMRTRLSGSVVRSPRGFASRAPRAKHGSRAPTDGHRQEPDTAARTRRRPR